jgi:hypothetical protein
MDPSGEAPPDLYTLDRVVSYWLSRDPPRLVVDVVKQDEFTQDVVFRDGDRYLVYDTT